MFMSIAKNDKFKSMKEMSDSNTPPEFENNSPQLLQLKRYNLLVQL